MRSNQARSTGGGAAGLVLALALAPGACAAGDTPAGGAAGPGVPWGACRPAGASIRSGTGSGGGRWSGFRASSSPSAQPSTYGITSEYPHSK